ncbi:MAG: hypothetical protein LH481_02725 [Burkholderiales bacterium]|nr:hypothetical protein [Burkholderiales bacterium]
MIFDKDAAQLVKQLQIAIEAQGVALKIMRQHELGGAIDDAQTERLMKNFTDADDLVLSISVQLQALLPKK